MPPAAPKAPYIGKSGNVSLDKAVFGEAFHTAKAFRTYKNLQTLEKSTRFGKPTLEDERHHAAESFHLPKCERMLWMVR